MSSLVRDRMEKDVYGNEVQRLGRPLPVEYLLVDVPASTPLVPLYTFLERKNAKQYFPVENRLIDGHIQDFAALADYLAKSRSMPFLDAVSDFHLLFYLYRMEDMLPMKSQLGPLLEAVRTKDKAKANEWKSREVWKTLEELIEASSNHDDSSMSNDVEFVPSGDAEQNWICTFCTFINSRELPACEICNLPRRLFGEHFANSGFEDTRVTKMRAMRVLCTIWLLLLMIKLYEGASNRKKTEVLSDVASTSFSECGLKSREEYYQRVRNPAKHITSRLLRYFTFGGILQAISEDTGIPRNELVTGGASELQDQSSGCGNDVHAAHVIRVASINAKLKKQNEPLNRALENYIGHTQNVKRDLNVWQGVGGAVDRYQSSNLTVLAAIDFTGTADDSWDNIVTLQATFRKIIDKYILKEQDSTTSTRETSERVSDDKSSVYDEGKHGSRDEYNRRVQDPDKHISERLVRYFRFGGILQAISEETNIPRVELVTGGASRFQDQSSGLGQSVHAAHIIRVGAINSKLKNKSPSLNRALQNYIGHTQNVLRAANAWHGIGGDVDKYQSNNLNILATIDFNGRYNDNEDTIETLQ
uniref:RanBP2-type domain-containing protein n=1 Tax=Anopheles culicifacies TaxID=139723 RepID=A0A182MG17_9DIPT